MPHLTIQWPNDGATNGVWREVHRAVNGRLNLLIRCPDKPTALSIRNTLRRYTIRKELVCIFKVKDDALMVAFF